MTEIMMNSLNILAVGILLASLMAMTTPRMGQLIRIFTLQSLMLAGMAALVGYQTGSEHLYIIASIIVLLKVFIIPRFLNYSIERIKVKRELEPLLGIPGSLLLSAAIVVLAYFVTEPVISLTEVITRNCLAISLAVTLIGLLLMITRRKAMTEVIGLLMMENGLFLAVISTSHGMPLIVEMGIFFDVLVAVIIMGMFAFRINETFETSDTSILKRLRY
ncbi:MAG: hydrogenase [Candidatus Methanomethylophilaceae archaeon]|nr:hydrogenase [Candidatus Methanomethylophilaceae archaeon]